MKYLVLFLCLASITPVTYGSVAADATKKKYGMTTSHDKARGLHDTLNHNAARKKSKSHGFFTKLKHGLWTCNASCTRHDVYTVLKKCVLTEQEHASCLHNLEADIENKNTKSKFGHTYANDVIPKHQEQIAALINARYKHLNEGKKSGAWEHNAGMLEKEKRVQIIVSTKA